MRTRKTKCNHTSLEINCNQITTRLWKNTGQATCPREFNAPRIDQLLDKHTDEVLLNAHDQAGVDLFCLRPSSCFSCLAGAWGPWCCFSFCLLISFSLLTFWLTWKHKLVSKIRLQNINSYYWSWVLQNAYSLSIVWISAWLRSMICHIYLVFTPNDMSHLPKGVSNRLLKMLKNKHRAA